ncbi:MAG: mechanosensitive ion channel [bacterium]|jgi:small conductance mechanosensitive channel
MENAQEILNWLTDMAIAYGLKLIGAIIVLIVGLWVIKLIMKGIRRAFEKREMDESLKPFLLSMINILLKVMLVISVLTMVGIEMTSFIAILGAAGLAVGLALSGTLQNFAGGVMLLIFKPFKVGDFIDAQGYMGKVEHIQIFVTTLLTPDNKTVIIPNGPLSTGSLVNFSAQPTRRVDLSFGIAYGDDYDKASAWIMDLMKKDERILSEPEPFVGLKELADSSVNIAARAWVNASDYWPVYFDMHRKFYKGADAQGISIPFPQLDVHLEK